MTVSWNELYHMFAQTGEKNNSYKGKLHLVGVLDGSS